VRGTHELELADSADALENFGGLLLHRLFVCFEALHLGFVPPLGRASPWSWPRGWLASLAPFGFAVWGNKQAVRTRAWPGFLCRAQLRRHHEERLAANPAAMRAT